MIFVDTSAWFALFVPADPHHARMINWLASNDQSLITTDYCVDETLTLLAARREIQRASEVGNAFFEERVARLHFLTREEIGRAWVVFQQRVSDGWSFTDCTSYVVMTALGIRIALALDTHFRQVRNLVVLP